MVALTPTALRTRLPAISNIARVEVILLKNVGDSGISVRFCICLRAVSPFSGRELALNSFESYISSLATTELAAGTTIALLLGNLQDWLPGVAGAEPRLGSGFLGGQFKKGGLHQPPFSFRSLLLRGGSPVREDRFPRVCRRSGWFAGPGCSGPFVLLSRVARRGVRWAIRSPLQTIARLP